VRHATIGVARHNPIIIDGTSALSRAIRSTQLSTIAVPGGLTTKAIEDTSAIVARDQTRGVGGAAIVVTIGEAITVIVLPIITDFHRVIGAALTDTRLADIVHCARASILARGTILSQNRNAFAGIRITRTSGTRPTER
jgi:hypothetical protein